jgi:hypothetical protein
MFASKSIGAHLSRGAVGIGAFVCAAILSPDHPWIALGLLPAAIVAFRGCPMCWTLGLVQTVTAKFRGRRAPRACIDGSCAARPHQ